MINVHYEYGFWFKQNTSELIKECAFGGTYFRDIQSGVNGLESCGKNLMI